jgi:pyruvate/2-oxoglutarate dehydrogenase complex dihydrolipoamide dehydrogenase (E3) component
MQTSFETIVIGAGSGGLTVAIGLAGLGRKVALIEAKHIGGDCTNVGCIPSKTLIHLAEHFHAADTAPVLAEVQHKRDHLREEETETVANMANLTLIHGWARFVAPKKLEVSAADGSKQVVSAEKIVIAAGSRPRHLAINGLPAERNLTNESIFEIRQAPRHLAVLGAGVIALEMAFAFRKLGSEVTVITHGPRVFDAVPPEASAAVQGALEDRQIRLILNGNLASYDLARETLLVKTPDGVIEVAGVDRVLQAIGRERNLDNLGLETTGIIYDKSGIKTTSFGETNVAGLYAIGDITQTSRFTHSANAQGRRVVQRIAFPFLPAGSPEPLYPAATFSDPEIATVGLSWKEIGERYHPEAIKRLRIDLRKIDRGYTDGVEHGFILVEAIRLTGKILSVTIVGPRASEMISFFTLAISQGISLYKLYRLVYPYPTYSGGIQKVADQFMRETLPNLKTEIISYLKYRWARPTTLTKTTYATR